MKYVIFGTGKFAEYYSKCVESDDIIGYIDNDEKKQGSFFYGKRVYSPNQFRFDSIDFVIIMVSRYEGIVSQLKMMGVDEEKIISYKEMGRKLNLAIYIHYSGKKIALKNWNCSKSIMLMVHDLSRTGVPVAAMHLAELFKEMGFEAVIASLGSGNIVEEMDEKKIAYIENLGAFDHNLEFIKFIDIFDCVVMTTLAISQFAVHLEKYKKPIFWWINETHENVFEKNRLPIHRENTYYFTDGKKTLQMFNEYYPERHAENLYYYLPDNEVVYRRDNNDKIRFGMIATHTRRKGQDILVDSIALLPDNIREKMVFYIIGPEDKTYTKEWKFKAERFPEITLVGELNQNELMNMYSTLDVLICPSREDTVPVVVTQAFQNGIPCIVSDQVGHSIYMNRDYGGYVFESENIKALADSIVRMYKRKKKRKRQGKEGRRIFEQYFSKQAVKKVINDMIIPHI